MDQEFSIGETENARALLLRGEILREEETTVCANCVTEPWLKAGCASIDFLRLATATAPEDWIGRIGSAGGVEQDLSGKQFHASQPRA